MTALRGRPIPNFDLEEEEADVLRPPYSPEVEQSVLGAMLLSRGAVECAIANLEPSDFYVVAYSRIFEAMRQLYEDGAHIDVATTTDILRHKGWLEIVGPLLVELQISAPYWSPEAVRRYAIVIKREAAGRRALAVLDGAKAAIYDGRDPYEVAGEVTGLLGDLDRIGILPPRYWSAIDAYLDQPDALMGQWLITGFCYRDSRILVLAAEKSGKSSWLRQIAYCASQGLHPGRLTEIPPVRVLMVDAENPDREMITTGRQLRQHFERGRKWDDSRLSLFSRPFGLDLRSSKDRNELEAVLDAFKPELVVGGPIYKMLPAKDGENDVRHADAFQQIMGDMMRRHHFALILEHHAPIGDKSGRTLRSMGGQRWQAWPDVTLALKAKDDDLIVEKPHPTRGTFDFPVKLTRERDWPWVATYVGREQPVLESTEGEAF